MFQRFITSNRNVKKYTRKTPQFNLSFNELVSLRFKAYFSTRTKQDCLDPIVSCPMVEELNAKASSTIKFVDASWYLDPKRNAKEEFQKERIPGAVYFDIDKVADTSVSLPHMLPSAKYFEECVSGMGISNDDKVIVYGGKSCFSSSRCWWMFKCFGHDNVFILNGGIEQWKKEGRSIDGYPYQPPKSSPSSFSAKFNKSMVATSLDTLKGINGDTQILDARPNPRFRGVEKEPRPGVKSGCIPNSKNVPFSALLKTSDFTIFKDKNDLENEFNRHGVDLSSKGSFITSCGSGVTACVLLVGLIKVGIPIERIQVYDGSWSEWGGSCELPIEVKG